ncbi:MULTISPECIES: hypothetical protein [unclassified Streptomyces]|uniref:hypothetical protein n=1 Tax=unclassified Streptomyces TaxID=2593676 RepID=UPI00332EF908
MDVVDSDELLRRIQRARDWAGREEESWKSRTGELRGDDPDGARRAEVYGSAFETVRKVLDEIVSPGRSA